MNYKAIYDLHDDYYEDICLLKLTTKNVYN